MSRSPAPFDRPLDADQQAVFDTISGRFREIDVAFNAIASEVSILGDAGRLDGELRRRLRRDLRELIYDVKVLDRGLQPATDGSREGDDPGPRGGGRR